MEMAGFSSRLETFCSGLAQDLQAELHGLVERIAQLEQDRTKLARDTTDLRQYNVQLEQSNDELATKVERLQQNNNELQQTLESLMTEQKKYRRAAKHTKRRLDEQQKHIDEQEHFILQVQAENDTLKNRLATHAAVGIDSDYVLPSSEGNLKRACSQHDLTKRFVGMSDTQPQFDPWSPRSTTFAGDEIPSTPLSAAWFSAPAGTPTTLHSNGRLARSQINGTRKGALTTRVSMDPSGVFKKPQLPAQYTDSLQSNLSTEELATTNPLAGPAASTNPAKHVMMRNLGEAEFPQDAYTPKKRVQDGYYTENIVLRNRRDTRSNDNPTACAFDAVTDQIERPQRSISSPDPITLDTRMFQVSPERNESVQTGDMQAALDALNKKFNTRTGAMQAAASSTSTISGQSEEKAVVPATKKYDLRGAPRKSAKVEAARASRKTEGNF